MLLISTPKNVIFGDFEAETALSRVIRFISTKEKVIIITITSHRLILFIHIGSFNDSLMCHPCWKNHQMLIDDVCRL